MNMEPIHRSVMQNYRTASRRKTRDGDRVYGYQRLRSNQMVVDCSKRRVLGYAWTKLQRDVLCTMLLI